MPARSGVPGSNALISLLDTHESSESIWLTVPPPNLTGQSLLKIFSW
ncbi:Uncharacterised protein, partial [Mycoplasmopsis edwardii]